MSSSRSTVTDPPRPPRAAVARTAGAPARRRFAFSPLLPLLLLPLLAPAPPTAAAPPSFTDFLARMESHFQQHPELKGREGTGWNPYNRLKWFEAPVLESGGGPTPRQRWDLFEEKWARSRAQSTGSAWFELGPVNLSGRILDIEFDPANAAIVYVGSASGGLWKSTDHGATWVPKTDELPSLAVGGIAVSPADPRVVLIGTGEGTPNADRVPGVGVLKSTDGGSTWNPTGLSFSVQAGMGFHFIEVDPATNVYLAGTNDGLYRSTDEGDTWTEVDTGQWWDAVWRPATTDVYAVGGGAWYGGNTVYLSTDDGSTWSPRSTGLPSSGQVGKSKLALSPSSPNPITIYAHLTATGGYSTLGIYRSTDAGLSWQLRSNQNIAEAQGWYSLSIASSPSDWNTVVTGGVWLWKSTDGGATFVEVGGGNDLGSETEVHVDHHAFRFEPGSSSALWCGTDGGVWRSTDTGWTWTSAREGLNTYQFYDVCASQSDPAWLLGGTQDNGIPRPDSGQDWLTSTLDADGMVCNVDPGDATIVFGESQFGNQVKSTDSGASWTDIQGAMPVDGGAWVTPVAMDRTDPSTLFACVSNNIYRTTDGGGTWVIRTSFSARWLDVNPTDGSHVWAVGSSGSVRYSTNGGNSWASAAPYGLTTGVATKIAADPATPEGAFVTFASFSPGVALVARTTDLGATWTDVTGDLPAQPVNTMIVDRAFPDTWYLGTDTGVWQTTDGGASWLPFDTGLPNVVVSDLEIRDAARKLVAGTYGRGAWEIDLPSSGTGVAAAADGPVGLMLDPPSPNPVSGVTRLRFAARNDGPVTLSIYDVAGRRLDVVARFASGDGRVREALWDAKDVAAGVYFAVLESGQGQRSRKIVVAR